MAKKIAKSNGKASKKSATPKAKPENNSFSVQGDGCRGLAKASEGKLTVDQCRILRALKAAKKSIDRADLKEAVGIGRHGLYSSAWLNGLNELDESKLIKIEAHEPTEGNRAKMVHGITAKGIDLLAKLEKGAKEAEKAESKEEADKAKAKAAKEAKASAA